MTRKRRPHGEGSVFPYRDGYAAVLDLGWVDGRRRRRWVYGPTERVVLDKLRQLQRRSAAGENLAATPRSLGDWLTEWVTIKSREGTRPSTLRSYRWLIETHIRPALGRVALVQLTPTMIRRHLADREDTGLSPSTVRHIHSLIRNVLADAEREELVTRNVAKAVRPPAAPTTERRYLTTEEARTLIAAISGDRLEALWVTALTVGLRRGELLGLRWSDVDLPAGVLSVRQTLFRADGRLQFGQPKTDRSRRTVPVPPPAVAALRAHRQRQAAARLVAGARWQHFDLVFASTLGTPLEPRNVDRAWQAVRAAAGLPWLRLHDLRHACATFLLASGASPRTVMKTLGHSQIALTMNTYGHVLPDIERTAVDEAARRLFG